jgi:hypothetical protein
MTRTVWIAIDLMAIGVICAAFGLLLSPADPYSFLMYSLELFVLSGGGYFCGFRRGAK